MLTTFKKHSKKIAASAMVLGSTVASAAGVALPAGAQGDITDSIGTGGGLMITAGVAVVGYVVVARLLKKI